MNTYNAEHIKDLSFFNKNVYLDKKFLLLIPETPLTAELKAILNEWDFSLLYSDGEPSSFMSVRTDTASGKDVLDSSKENEIISDKLKKQKEIMEETENKFWDFLRFTDKRIMRFCKKRQKKYPSNRNAEIQLSDKLSCHAFFAVFNFCHNYRTSA